MTFQRGESPSPRNDSKAIFQALMGMIEVPLKRARSLAQFLAILAAVMLGLDLHPAHAQLSGDAADHNHLSASCDSPDLAQLIYDGAGGVQSTNGDCTHHVDSMIRSLIAW